MTIFIIEQQFDQTFKGEVEANTPEEANLEWQRRLDEGANLGKPMVPIKTVFNSVVRPKTIEDEFHAS